jgi:membrane protease YdiL (CAAX protease family)
MRLAVWFFAAAIVIRLVAVRWSAVDVPLFVVTIGLGALIGYAEELLFRGIVLRSLRTRGRTEASAALWTAAGFGLFHLPNLLVGVGALQAGQIVLAAITGVSLYLLRRYRGTIVMAMVGHGIWDISTFLVATNDAVGVVLLNVLLILVGLGVGIAALVSIWRHDRDVVISSPADVAPR